MMPSRKALCILVSVSLLSIPASADPPSTPPEVVLRVSHDLLDELVPPSLSQTFEIDTTVESTRFRGNGIAAGLIDVQLEPDQDGAVFVVAIQGESRKHFSGSQDPIRFRARSDGPFTTTTRVTFDGRRFQTGVTRSWSRQSTSIHGLCSRQKGLVGKVVRQIGWQRVCDSRSKMNKYISERVENGVSDALDDVVVNLVDELNELIAGEIMSTLKEVNPTSENWTWQLSTGKDSLQAAVGPHTKPNLLNVDPLAHQKLRADIEVWIRLSPEEATLLGLGGIWADSHDLLKGMLSKDQAALLPEDAKLEAIDNWALISIGRRS